MINILASVRRPFSGKILSGEKGWELRKNAPRIPRGEHVTLWLYESGKDGERSIIGKCRMVSYVALHHMPSGRALDLLKKDACVTEEHLRAYLPCYAWGVMDPVRLPAAVPLSAIGLTRPPQSWQYISPEQAAILERNMKTCEGCDLYLGFQNPAACRCKRNISTDIHFAPQCPHYSERRLA